MISIHGKPCLAAYEICGIYALAMRELGVPLIFAGIIAILLGIFFSMGGSLSWLGRLPGDIRITRPSFNFYFPVTTSIFISIIVSLALYLIRHFR
jgi:hypothetical protein